jgi:hypothetical protein
MDKPFYYISAYLDISSLLPVTPNTEFDIRVYLNKQNNLEYLILDNIQDYTQFYTINSGSTITDVVLYSNPSLNSLNYLTNIDFSQVQLFLTDSLFQYDQDRLQCYYRENYLYVSVIDIIGKYAYFATSNFFDTYAIILKVDLVSFSIVDSLKTPYGYNFSVFASIDPLSKTLYLGCRKGFGESQLFRIDLDTFTFSGSIVFSSLEILETGVIDNAGLYMYVSITSFNPIQIYKINLVTFTIVDTLMLNPGEQVCICALIDNFNQYLYLGISNNPGSVVKIDLNTFTRVSTLILSSAYPIYGLTDPSGQNIYFVTGSNFTPPVLVQIRLSSFTETSSLVLPGISFCGCIDPLGKYIYAMTYIPGTLIVIAVSTLTITNTYSIPSSSNIRCVCIDPPGQYLYAGQETFPGYIQKISLSPTFSLVNSLEGRQGVNNFSCGAVEQTAQYAYLGSSAGVTKVDLPTWSIVENLGFSASVILIDPNGKYIYFNAVKVDLVTQLAVASAPVGNILSAVIDPLGNFAYYGTDTSIVKVNLKTMTVHGSIILPNPEFDVQCALMDLEGNYAYFGVRLFLGPPPPFYSRIIQVDLKTFTRKAQLDLNIDENVSCAVLDQQGVFGYFGCNNLGAQVIRVHLTTLCRVASISLNSSGVRFIKSAVHDPNSSYAYFASEFNAFFIPPTPPLEYIAKVDLVLLQVVDVYNFDITRGIPAAFTTTKAPYVYFGSLDGYLIRIPDISNYPISGLSGNTPGNLINNNTITDIDYKSQNIKLQRNQQNPENHYFNLRVKGITKSTLDLNPVTIHAQMKIFPSD